MPKPTIYIHVLAGYKVDYYGKKTHLEYDVRLVVSFQYSNFVVNGTATENFADQDLYSALVITMNE